MLYFEPADGYETTFPPEVVGMIRVLAAIGFKNGVGTDLASINRHLEIPFVEVAGKLFYDGKVAGYPRGCDPATTKTEAMIFR